MPPFICLRAGAADFCEAMTDGYLRRVSLETTLREKFSRMLFVKTYLYLCIRDNPILHVALYPIAESMQCVCVCVCLGGGGGLSHVSKKQVVA